MKALSIKQPWAWLIAIGLKDIENRSWPTNYRGFVYIHASAKDSKSQTGYELLSSDQFSLIPRGKIVKYLDSDFDRSAIIGEVEIVDCVQNSDSIWAEPGQWHWQLKNARLFEQPYKNVKGKLSFWDFEPI